MGRNVSVKHSPHLYARRENAPPGYYNGDTNSESQIPIDMSIERDDDTPQMREWRARWARVQQYLVEGRDYCAHLRS